MRVLVLGASGFIGRHLCRGLAAAGHDVVEVVRRGGEEVNRASMVYAMDVSLPGLRSRLAGERVDAVVHLAQGDGEFPDDAVNLHRVNTGSVVAALDFTRMIGASVFVLASSGSVYGRVATPEGHREDGPCQPPDFYALTKRHAEEMAERFARFFPTTVFRLFTPYGPGQSGRLVPRLIEQIVAGQPLAMPAEGATPRFNPIYVSEVVETIGLALKVRSDGIFNLGGPEVLSLREMAEIIGRRLGVAPVFGGGPSVSIVDCFGDVSKLKRELGLAPSISFGDGIGSMLHGLD